MIVYVESNFLLELSLMRAEKNDCEMLIRWAEQGLLTLALPSFSVTEVYEALIRRKKIRNKLQQDINRELGELARSQPYQTRIASVLRSTHVITQASEAEQLQLDQVLHTVLNSILLLPINAQIIQQAAFFRQQFDRLELQDSIVVASIWEHLQHTTAMPRIFVSQDRGIAANPDIEALFEPLQCRLFSSFRNVAGYLIHQHGLR